MTAGDGILHFPRWPWRTQDNDHQRAGPRHPSSSPVKILLAEDIVTTRRILEQTLRDDGHEVEPVGDGIEAWAAYERGEHDMLVLDWLMPGIDGLEVCRRVRRAEAEPETYILVQTGRDTPQDLTSVLDAGADDYISKPITPEALRTRVQIAQQRIRQNEARRAAEAGLKHARWLEGVAETVLAMEHEINNPLSALLGSLSLASQEDTIAAYREANQAAMLQTRRIADVVRKMSTLQRPGTIEPMPGFRMLDVHSRTDPER